MLTSDPPGTAELSLIHDYVHTGPSCTRPVCSPGVWSNASHLLLLYLSSWARSLGKEPCTWPGDNTVAENHHPTQTITQFIPGIKTSISGVYYANSGRNPNCDDGCSYLWRKISYLRRYANPARLTLRCSIRPRYLTWCLTSTSSKRPAGDRQEVHP